MSLRASFISSLGFIFVPATWTDLQTSTQRLKEALARQINLKDTECQPDERPYVMGSPERNDTCPLGDLILDKSIFEGVYSRVFRASIEGDEFGSFVVKYQTDCMERIDTPYSSRNTLVDEFIYLELIKNEGISPKAVHVSPKEVLPQVPIEELGTTRFLGSRIASMYAQCASLKSEVRFLVQEEVGIALSQYIDEMIKRDETEYFSVDVSKQMIKITRKVISHLKTLHSYGILHNDIHFGNVAFRERSSEVRESDDVVLIDFGYAVFYPKYFNQGIYSLNLKKPNTRHLSLWQLRHERPGRRDDVYRALLMLADTLSRGIYSWRSYGILTQALLPLGNPPPNSRMYRIIDERVAEYIKSNFKLFKFDSKLDSGAIIGIDSETDNQIIEILTEIEDHVMAYSHPDVEIDYEFIDSKFQRILELFP